MSRRKWGALRKLPSGSYQARIIDKEGNRHSKTFPTRFLAEKYLEAMAKEIHGKDYKNYQIARGKRIRSYGLQVDEFHAMMDNQDGKCYICNGDNGLIALCIDHDHKTGKVRGLLCNNCNRALGLFQDNPKLLIKAVDYLINGVVPIHRDYPPLSLITNKCV